MTEKVDNTLLTYWTISQFLDSDEDMRIEIVNSFTEIQNNPKKYRLNPYVNIYFIKYLEEIILNYFPPPVEVSIYDLTIHIKFVSLILNKLKQKGLILEAATIDLLIPVILNKYLLLSSQNG